MKKRVHLLVVGKFEPIFFRVFVRTKALKLGLTGFVRSSDADKLEIVVEGEAEKIQKLIELCERGPPNSEVEEIKVLKKKDKVKFKGFIIKI